MLIKQTVNKNNDKTLILCVCWIGKNWLIFIIFLKSLNVDIIIFELIFIVDYSIEIKGDWC